MAQQTTNLVNGVDLAVLHDTIDAMKQDPELGKCRFRASNKWIDGDHNRTTISDFFAAGEERSHKQSFDLDADEPPMLAGDDQAPGPFRACRSRGEPALPGSLSAAGGSGARHSTVPSLR